MNSGNKNFQLIINNEKKSMFLNKNLSDENKTSRSYNNKKLLEKIYDIENTQKIFYNSNIKVNT